LVGSGIDQNFYNSRRSTFDSRGTGAMSFFENLVDDDGLPGLGTQARKLFNICYLPSIVNGESHPLMGNWTPNNGGISTGVTCNHETVFSGAVGTYTD